MSHTVEFKFYCYTTEADGDEVALGESKEAGMDRMQAFKTLYLFFALLFHHSLPCCEHESYLFSAREH